MLPNWVFSLPWEIIRAKATLFSLDPYILASIIMVESSGNACAIRYEYKWKYLYEVHKYSRLVKSTTLTEEIGQKTSWGYMQVMGSVAREHSFEGWFPELCLPDTGIEYGARHFYKFFKKYGDLKEAIASYNGGSPVIILNDNGKSVFKNQVYVDKVLDYYGKLLSYGH